MPLLWIALGAILVLLLVVQVRMMLDDRGSPPLLDRWRRGGTAGPDTDPEPTPRAGSGTGTGEERSPG